MSQLIPLLIVLPLMGALLTYVISRASHSLAQTLAIITAIGTLVLAISLRGPTLEPAATESVSAITPNVQFAPAWLKIALPGTLGGQPIEWQIQFGIDGLGWVMVLLTAIITFSVMAASIKLVTHHVSEYLALVLCTEAILMGVFTSMDLISFYVCFEAVLIPLLVMILYWGDEATRGKAAKKFLLFTLAGSIPMVLGFASLAAGSTTGGQASTISLPGLSQLPVQHSGFVLAMLLLGFGIKLGVLPLHTWLPTTYAASHPTTTALLSAVVLKLGTFGLLRIAIPILPDACHEWLRPVLGSLGAVAILYGALIALRQRELRGLLAYSSLSHVGFISLGLASLNVEGLSGAALQMLNHGLIVGGSFLLLGMLEARHGPLTIDLRSGGLATRFPTLAVLMVFFVMAGAGVPGLNSFVGELLSLSGMFRATPCLTVIGALGIILGAWYSLRMLQWVFFSGSGQEPLNTKRLEHGRSDDIGNWESLAIAPCVLGCIVLGLYPQYSVRPVTNDVEQVAKRYIALDKTPQEVALLESSLPVPTNVGE